MQIVHIKNSIQNAETVEPELIDGEVYHWEVSPILLLGTLKEEIERLKRRGIKYLLIYDVISVHKHFCDQGCKPNEGCKQGYSENRHAIMLNCVIIKNEQEKII